MWQVALLPTLMSPVDLETVWTRYVAASAVEVSGEHLLLRTEGVNYTLMDAGSGQTIGRFENVNLARLSSGHVLLVRGAYDALKAIEAWTTDPFQQAWSMPVSEQVSLGEIVGDSFTFATRHKLIKVSIPGFQEIDRREWTNTLSNFRNMDVRASTTRIFFRRGPEVFGLNIDDFSQGWRNYCGSWPQHVDELGFVGTGRLYYPLAIVRPDGKSVDYERTIEGHYTFWREAPGVTKDVVVATGNVGRGASTPTSHEFRLLSPYLFAFDRRSGKELWRIAIAASDTVVVGGRLMHIGSNTISGKVERTLQLRELHSGKLLWKSRPIDDRAKFDLATNGEIAFELTEGRIRALRVVR